MKILIADDETATCEMYRIVLKARGHDVVVTHDGKECARAYQKEYQKCGNQSPPFDAVVLDCEMPNFDGFDAAREILNLNKDQRIIFATAHTIEALKDSIRRLMQISEILQKPFEPRLLAELVEDTSAAKKLRGINKIVHAMDSVSHITETDYLMRVLKETQKIGL